ncbi:hypothetical protein Patl1_36641 [Pistacia atlantica]|nr:hypothetical protein Patl1_36641 [Pistacia atlantica]
MTPEYNEEGIYTVCFCIQGEWVPVVVDDWIPCESLGKPKICHQEEGDALVDLIGGVGEEIDIRSAQAQIDLASGRLWSQLLHFKQERFLLGVGSPSGSDVHISSSGIVGMLAQYCR